ncbi:MAG: T9SS type A sorting domain-containing protein [Chitinophagales bacterium]
MLQSLVLKNRFVTHFVNEHQRENYSETENKTNSISFDEKQLKLYPTLLIENKITIEAKGLNYFDYIILDMQGKIITKKYNIQDNLIDVNLPNLSRGVYFVKINALQYSKTIKLIKE